jgi:hypothetical protein
MRHCIEQSNGLVPSLLCPSWVDCIIATRGYDFRKGHGIEQAFTDRLDGIQWVAPHQSYLGCTIVTRGYDFREGQVSGSHLGNVGQ